MKTLSNNPPPGLPTRAAIVDFIATSKMAVGKREIAKHFALRGADKIALKALLKDMTDEGLVDLAPGRAFHKHGGLPRVTVLKVAAVEGDAVWALPDRWEADTPPPRVRVLDKGRRGPGLKVGDRVLARTEERGSGHAAHVMKLLASADDSVLGVLVADTGPGGKPMLWLRSVDKKVRHDWAVSDAGDAGPGDLVMAELSGRGAKARARVTTRLGDPMAPRALSLIAIHKHEIPHVFANEVLVEGERATRLPLDQPGREDLRHLPILAIDPADARDHDDAIWAAPDDDPANRGGYRAIVAIADVSFYVRPGGALDREARRRGNSVYFPDRVVPMLPEQLSADICSLRAGEDRAAMVCHLTVDRQGRVTHWRFARALVRLAVNLPYERAQAIADGEAADPVHKAALEPLWACWRLLAKARDSRNPLNLDLPERQVMLDEQGGIAEIRVRERLDAHRLVEDYMIAANVAAAKALESRKSPVMYRIHEPPSREKLVSLKEYLATFGQNLALGQVITPAVFNRLLDEFAGADQLPQVMEAVLRSQTQAYYGPANAGHFGLALGSYAHFTSPIRRYADLIVHRALVDAFALDEPVTGHGVPARSGLDDGDAKSLTRIGEAISALERRAMAAERETVDRYVAAWLAGKVGEVVAARITGVQAFGFFATVEGLGGDGLVPASALDGYFTYDEAARVLENHRTGVRYTLGQRLDLRLVDANAISGALIFALPDGHDAGEGGSAEARKTAQRIGTKRRGRPANIRHQGRRR